MLCPARSHNQGRSILMAEYIKIKRGDYSLDDQGKPDFTALLRKVFTTAYAQGRAPSLSVVDGDDAFSPIDAKYLLFVSTKDFAFTPKDVNQARRTRSWTNLGVHDCLAQIELPTWWMASNVATDRDVNAEAALLFARDHVETRRLLSHAQQILNQAERGQLEEAAMSGLIGGAAQTWHHSAFRLCYDHAGMYVLDLTDAPAGTSTGGHTLYPFFSIITGHHINSKSLPAGHPGYIKACLEDVAVKTPECGADEYIVADAKEHLKAIKTSRTNGFLKTASCAEVAFRNAQEENHTSPAP